MSIPKLLTDLKSSLWFVPSLVVLFSIGLAVGAIEADGFYGGDFAQRFPRVFGAGAEGSRQLLGSIASSTITVAGVVFSITIVALSLAAAQYSPRVLRNFMKDRANQLVFGVFVGIFVYCVIVLRTIRGGEESFIPGISVVVAIALSLLGIAFLIFFIHHIATQIQVAEMAARIAHQTMRAVEEAEERSRAAATMDDANGAGAVYPVRARATGYIQHIHARDLLDWARETGRNVRIDKCAGEFVAAGEVLLWVSGAPASDGDGGVVSSAISISTYRDLQQDPAFGVQQLVDIALKALSPGVNDTGTARDALNYISAILLDMARDPPSSHRVWRAEGCAVFVRTRSFEELVTDALGPLRRNAQENFDFTRALIGAIGMLARHCENPRVRRPLAAQLATIEETMREGTYAPTDSAALEAAVSEAREALRHGAVGSAAPGEAQSGPRAA